MSSIKNEGSARIPTKQGTFQLHVYIDQEKREHAALVMGDVAQKNNVLTRIHSECQTGDIFGSIRCDCGEQLQHSMEMITKVGLGILVYLRQEGRGIGLVEKLKAYNLQDQGYDTVEANLFLGHRVDNRDYAVAGDILRDLKVASIQILTNNPDKIQALQDIGVEVRQRIPVHGAITHENQKYLQTKIDRMNHFPVQVETERKNEH